MLLSWLLYINLHSSSLVSAVQTEDLLFSENLLYFFTSQFTCCSSLLKSRFRLPCIILTSFIIWQLFVGRWLCISSKYTLKTLKRNALLKEFCDLLVLLVMVPMPGDEGLFGLSSSRTSEILLSSHPLSGVKLLSDLQGRWEACPGHRAAAHRSPVDGVPVPLPVCLKVGQSIFGRQFFKWTLSRPSNELFRLPQVQ